MIKILNFKYIKNNFLSEKQFLLHENIYKNSVNCLNLFLYKKNILFKNKFELIDILNDLSEFDKNNFSNILGNYLNHEFYFKNICFNKTICFGEVYKNVLINYNSYENFKFNFINFFINFTGWGWIVINNNNFCLVKTYENNNPMFSIELGGYNSYPILCIDLNEHSYFIDYNNNKKKYLESFLDNINWYEVENRYQNFILNN
ncbi:Fe-Mn family superoxide dismutase [Candidatus Carsonella ruddii]|uniref:Fe-Mn family superoxide dismutase n=1 Tax=Carsonella ruddii TaxID=114186 RepID=UPI003D5073E7